MPSKQQRKKFGWFDTPMRIVNFMIRLIPREYLLSAERILEPACGYAPFSEAIAKIRGTWRGLIGVEINRDTVRKVREKFPDYDVREGDFLLMDFGDEKFDIIIGNPPYGIIGDESHYPISVFKNIKDKYKRLYSTWKGKYNIYGLFVEKSIKLLKDRGILVFIIPATWVILDEFEKLRRFIGKHGRISVYYVGRVFKGLNVIACILYFEMGKQGLRLYDAKDLGKPILNREKNVYNGEIISFETKLTRIIEKKKIGRLGDLFEIRISPRTTEIRRLNYVIRECKSEKYICLLNGKNLKTNVIEYEKCYSGFFIAKRDIKRLRKWFIYDRIVVGHTKGGKLVAAIDRKHYPWMGDVYHLIPKNLATLWHTFSLDEINDILNSKIMNQYMRDKYRDIIPHVTKTQLKMLPLIPLSELKKIEQNSINL